MPTKAFPIPPDSICQEPWNQIWTTQRGLTAATKLEDWVDYAIRSDCAPYSLAQFDNLAQKTRLSRLVVQRVQVTVASLRLFLRSSTGPNRAFEPQSLGRVRDPVRIVEGPTAIAPIWWLSPYHPPCHLFTCQFGGCHIFTSTAEVTALMPCACVALPLPHACSSSYLPYLRPSPFPRSHSAPHPRNRPFSWRHRELSSRPAS